MARQIGTLTAGQTKGGARYFRGHIESPAVAGKFRFRPYQGRSEQAPDYKIDRLDPETGQVFEDCGAAWVKALREGGTFLSITLDDETMEQPLHCAAFLDEEGDGDTWRVMWGRAKRKSRATAAAAPAAPDDEIPF